MEQDPKELIILAKKGDKEAFGKLYSAYFVPVYRYIYVRVGEKAASEDLTQEAFLKVYNSLDRFEDIGKEPLSYFFTVARNLCIDYFRKKKEVSLETRAEQGWEVEDSSDDPEEQVMREETGQVVRKAILQLNDSQREAVLLRFVNDFSYAEIAQILGKREVAIRQAVSRALKALKKILKGKI